MRVRLWLVVVFLVSRHLSVAAAEGEPRDSIAGAVTGNAAVADTPLTRDAAKARVTVRVYSSTRIAGAQRAALDGSGNVCGGVGPDRLEDLHQGCVRCASRRRRSRAANGTTEGDGDRHLGNALIDPQNRDCVLATKDATYLGGRLELEIDHHKLLGRTVAHEIGHLLLATNTHAAWPWTRGLVARRVAADTARRLDTSSARRSRHSAPPRTRRSRVWKSRRGQRPRRPLARPSRSGKAGLSTRLRDCDSLTS